MIYTKKGRFSEAAEALNTAIQIRKKTLGARHPQTGIAMHSLAHLYAKEGNYILAAELLHEAADIFRTRFDAAHPDYVHVKTEEGIAFGNRKISFF